MIEACSCVRALRRFRRLHGIKQTHLAEMLGVTQGSVSRWESGVQVPDDAVQGRIAELIAARTTEVGDTALKRLLMTSPLRVHLICDATHRLLAASPARVASWRTDASTHIGNSLWRYASPEIIAAEEDLTMRDWFDTPFQSLRFHTGVNDSDTIVITAGLMEWQSIILSDGRVGRLTTAIDSHA